MIHAFHFFSSLFCIRFYSYLSRFISSLHVSKYNGLEFHAIGDELKLLNKAIFNEFVFSKQFCVGF
jgi:hypothetical protein